MKSILFATALVSFVVGSAFMNPPATEVQWQTDYEAAVQQAQDEDKEILLFFTGSDWCGWCKKFNKDVLTQEAFIEYANENLVCVVLDFPRATPISSDLRQQNSSLAGQYGVRGYPSFRLLDANENLLHSLNGYQQGGPSAFISQLDRFVSAP